MQHQAQSSRPQCCLADQQGSQVQPLAEEHKRGWHQGAGACEVHLETGSTRKAQALSWGEADMQLFGTGQTLEWDRAERAWERQRAGHQHGD